MTKLLLSLTAVSLCFAGTALAQQQKNHFTKKTTAAHTTGSANKTTKTTGTESRLIATASWFYDAGLDMDDSTRFTYSPNRGWEYELGEWKFDTGLGWTNDNGTLVQDFRMNQTFDSKNHIKSSIFEVHDGSGWVTDEMAEYTYTASGKLLTDKYAYFDGTDWDSSRYTATYNSPKEQLVEYLSEDWDAQTQQWIYDSRFINTYNSNDKLEKEYTLNWGMASGTWDTGMRTTYTYNSNGQEIEVLYESYQVGSWVPSQQFLSTYDSKGNVTETESKSWNGMNGTWDNNNKTISTYDNNNREITTVYQSYMGGTYQNSEQTTYTYNAYNQILTEVNKRWNASTGQFEFQMGDRETHNYYEEFTNSVKDAISKNSGMRLYPVPANNQLHIQLENTQGGSLLMYDMSGRMVKQATIAAGKNVRTTVDVSNLPAGSYHIKAINGGNIISQRVNIVK